MQENTVKLHPETLAVRGARTQTAYNEHHPALFLTSSFCFDNAEEGRALFAHDKEGFTYSRTANPTTAAFADRLAQLEGAQAAFPLASGMAALQAAFLTFLRAGDHLLCSKSLFGTTAGLVQQLPKFGIEVTLIPPADLSAWRREIRPNTKMLFAETPSNPLGEAVDIAALAELAHANGALWAVDNSLCSPALQQPVLLGADLTVYSATKAIDGQGRVIGGAVCGSAERIDALAKFANTNGLAMSPFNAWILTSGLETLFLRMEKQCATALTLARFLQNHEKIEKVYYPGLPEHPQYDLLAKQQSAGGTVVAFAVRGTQTEAWKVLDSLQIFSKTANLGDVRSTVTHPYTTTHCRVAPEEKNAAGITGNLLRIAVGLEHAADLQNDLQAALALV